MNGQLHTGWCTTNASRFTIVVAVVARTVIAFRGGLVGTPLVRAADVSIEAASMEDQ